ncbi:DUF6090 family protein [Winogradskyella jejuensis]|uniref:Uncharacterized protein n=1 Tax=Winogradskyella jejuensis TaxID=1089305 RepID=A0A1M5KXR0_9FLAO|nr:DUF6090 family protein [Winogradskyella jejuensis]SHG57588.1 hypothetical protein SAMN05444148_0466 [Winogradskyella jejuensis]
MSKLKKKFKYAFGEILIVIIGISLAFAMNKWGENTSNKAEKEQYIANLKLDITSDKKQLESNLDIILQKIKQAEDVISILGKDAKNKNQRLRSIYNIANLTSFTPKDYTHQTLINSGDLKLMNDFELKTAIQKHYSDYEKILNAYERQEIINRDYIGNYFIYNTDYDLVREGKSPFKDEKLLKNIMQSARGSLMYKRDATINGIKSCDSILKFLN